MGNRSAFLGFGFTFNGFVHIGCGLVKVHVRLGVVLGGLSTSLIASFS